MRLKMSDILFSTVERFNAPRPWGRFLDSGTGVHSLKWIQNLSTTGWTAITADNQMKAQIVRDAQLNMRPSDQLLVGNWMDEGFTKNLGKFDTILADYLIGAVDGFSPYQQDVILDKLRDHLNPNGRLFIIGMNPIPDHAPYPAEIVTEVRRARDAAILLAGHRPYREFPLEWITRHLERSRFKIVEAKSFSILHSEESILRQLRVGQSKLDLMPSSALKTGMEAYLTELGTRVNTAMKSTATGRIPLSSDYIIAAQLMDTDTDATTPGSVTGTGTGEEDANRPAELVSLIGPGAEKGIENNSEVVVDPQSTADGQCKTS